MAFMINCSKSFAQVGEPLERGYFGKVFLAKCVKSGREFAVNQIELKKVINGVTSKQEEMKLHDLALDQAKTLVTIGHPNLVRVCSWFEENGLLNVVMDYYDPSVSLASVIAHRKAKNKNFSEFEITHWANQLIHAVQYLNFSKDILHRDIRSENVYLTERGQIAKLGNFGIVKMLNDLFGTATHMPPEVIKCERYSIKSEMWALGVVLYHTACLSLPFAIINDDHDGLFKAILTKQPNDLPGVYNLELRGLITAKLLNKDPTARPDAVEALGTSIFLKLGIPHAKRGGAQQFNDAGSDETSESGKPLKLRQLFSDARRGYVLGLEEFIAEHGVETLLKVRDGNGDSVLHTCALYGHPAAVAFLLENGADIESRGYQGRTSLHSAACKGQAKVISLLLSRGAKVDARSFSGDDESCAIHLAASFGHLDTVRALLDSCPSQIDAPDQDCDLPIHRAALRGQSDVIEFLLSRGASIESKGQFDRSPLLCATSKGYLDTVTLLIKHGADIHAVSSKEDGAGTAVHIAAEFGYADTLTYLLKVEPSMLLAVDQNGNLPINAAAISSKPEILEMLVKKGASIEGRGYHGRTPFLNAVASGDAAMVKALMAMKVDVSVRSGPEDDECSCIHLAACFGHAEVVNVLLERFPGYINVQNKQKDYAINVAALNGHLSTVELLLQKGADIESKGFQGRTPLLSASSAGHTKTVEFLLKKGANIMAQTDAENYGDMAIHLAAYFGHLEVVTLLLKVKSNLKTAKNLTGELPMQRAISNKQQEVVDYLRKSL